MCVFRSLENPWFLHMRIRPFVLLKCFLFLDWIFPVRKSIFRKRGVCIRWIWSAFKRVWQETASLLSSWCNHLNRWDRFEMIFLLDSYSWRFFGWYMDYLIRLQHQSNSTSERGARASYQTILPELKISAWRSLLEPSFRYLSPGREGEKCRSLDHTWQSPFVYSAR